MDCVVLTPCKQPLNNLTHKLWLQVIAQYLLDAFHSSGASLTATSPEGRAVSNLVSRIHDQYVTPIQVT